MMKNFYLDPATFDLIIDNTFNIRMTENLVEYVSAKIENKLKTFTGEWFLNEDIGLPFFDRILIKNADLNDVTNLFRAEVLSIPEVTGLISFEVDQDNATRTFSITLEASVSEVETTGVITIETGGG